MVNRRPSDAAEFAVPVAPVVKRKRRASCLGEQERRERKRAIDREAQRSLREKTKTHIAELERTIHILRDQDRNGATANLLSEIDSLRAENDRLRDIIDSVKSVLGSEVAPRTGSAAEHLVADEGAVITSPASSSNGMHQLTQAALYDSASTRLTDGRAAIAHSAHGVLRRRHPALAPHTARSASFTRLRRAEGEHQNGRPGRHEHPHRRDQAGR